MEATRTLRYKHRLFVIREVVERKIKKKKKVTMLKRVKDINLKKEVNTLKWNLNPWNLRLLATK